MYRLPAWNQTKVKQVNFSVTDPFSEKLIKFIGYTLIQRCFNDRNLCQMEISDFQSGGSSV